MDRKYAKSPIKEALCEFQFVPNQPWDMTVAGLFYEKIKEEFPIKKQQVGYQFGFQPKEDGIEQKVEKFQRMQFFNSDSSALVQVGVDLLTINHLKPYSKWENFKSMIIENLKKYQELATPKGFKRIGLRYINKIGFSENSIEIKDYFNYYPSTPDDLPQMHDTFHVRVEIPYKQGRDHLIITLTNVIPEIPDRISLILDLDYIIEKPEITTGNQTSDWIADAHIEIKKAFEACITDKCRNLFDEVI